MHKNVLRKILNCSVICAKILAALMEFALCTLWFTLFHSIICFISTATQEDCKGRFEKTGIWDVATEHRSVMMVNFSLQISSLQEASSLWFPPQNSNQTTDVIKMSSTPAYVPYSIIPLQLICTIQKPVQKTAQKGVCCYLTYAVPTKAATETSLNACQRFLHCEC